MNEIEEYLNIVEQIKTTDKEKEALNFILNGFALCIDLLEDERQEKQELIDYLKEKKEGYIKLYDVSCDVIDFDRYECLKNLCEEILSKIEKE